MYEDITNVLKNKMLLSYTNRDWLLQGNMVKVFELKKELFLHAKK